MILISRRKAHMSEDTSNRKRYPSKISIVNVTAEMRLEMDEELKDDPELTEAQLVREAIREYLSKRKRAKSKKKEGTSDS
jgi:hypothetical protein